MNKKVHIIFFIILIFATADGQDKKKSFPKAVEENIKLYNVYSNVAYERGDLEKGNYLFDTLVSNQLVGTKFQDYTLKKIYGGKLKLSTIKKPIVIKTYAAWCVLDKGEVQAMNKLAKKYQKKVQLVVLFWDKKRDAKEIASKFNSYIEPCYANESYGRDEPILATMKYAIGFLTSYYLDENLNVIDIRKGLSGQSPPKKPMKECVQFHYDNNEKNFIDLISKSNYVENTKNKK
jgi:hypothetical protein